MNKDLISIIVPVYNGQKNIGRCIDSIIRQTYKKIEIIIVNDGSTDTTLNIVESYLQKDKRIRIINKENGGVSSARNAGINASNGEYISFVDSDDTIEKKMVEDLYEAFNKYNCDISICNYSVIKKNKKRGNNHNKSFFIKDRKAFYENMEILKGFLCNKMFKTNLIKQIRLDEKIHYCEDELCLIKYVERSNCFYYNKKPLYNYYIYDDSCSSWLYWNKKKITVLDAKEQIIKLLNKYEFNIYKKYYLDYFINLNDIYNRYDKSIIEKKKLDKIYKSIVRNKNYSYKIKAKVFIKYKFFNIYTCIRKIYHKVMG